MKSISILKKIIIPTLLVLPGTLVYANTVNINLQANSGPLSFDASDFHPDLTNAPNKVTFNETRPDRWFLHTFKYRVPKGCHAKRASLRLKVKKLQDSKNDFLGFFNNGTQVYNQFVWSQTNTANEPAGTTKTLTFNLGNLPNNSLVRSRPYSSILNTLNDGKFSFFVQDDTSVQSAQLNIVFDCPKPLPIVKGEHYQCYRLEKNTALKPETIIIQDQFGGTSAVLGRPRMLCNPSTKKHKDKFFNIQNKRRHLVCYDIVKQRPNRPKSVEISNQFEYQNVIATKREMFCVPSYKKHLDGKSIPRKNK